MCLFLGSGGGGRHLQLTFLKKYGPIPYYVQVSGMLGGGGGVMATVGFD